MCRWKWREVQMRASRRQNWPWSRDRAKDGKLAASASPAAPLQSLIPPAAKPHLGANAVRF